MTRPASPPASSSPASSSPASSSPASSSPASSSPASSSPASSSTPVAGPSADRFEALRARITGFVAARDWARFHNPKNLAMALVAEAGELAAELQWLTPAEADALDSAKKDAVAMEMADVLIYLIELGERLGVDPLDAAARKLDRNEIRYPVEKAFGNAKKYDEF